METKSTTANHRHSWKFQKTSRPIGCDEVYTIQACEICGKTRRVSTAYNPNSDKGKRY